MNNRQFQLGHGSISRALASLLLVFILHAATVEAAHSHRRVFASDSSLAVSHDSAKDVLAGAGLGCDDCLICQLQQTFSTVLLPHDAAGNNSLPQTQLRATLENSFQSLAPSAQRSRAPPSNS